MQNQSSPDESSIIDVQPIRLPEVPEEEVPPRDETLVVRRSTLLYGLLTLLLMAGMYLLGRSMAISSGVTAAAVREAVVTTVADLPGPRFDGVAVATVPFFTRDPGLPFSVTGHEVDLAALISQINPTEGFTLPVRFGKIGPTLIAAGAIDYDRFVQLYTNAGQPLDEAQLAVLTKGSDASVVFDSKNAYFLLNFFWAFGLSNQNRILSDGPMMQADKGQIANYASTGGWTVGTKPATELYNRTPIVTLTAEQQARLEDVVAGVYRPCCQNPTLFPDCNHGMAMLGLLELMASQDATTDAMFTAAKEVNAFWFPQQMLEVAMYFRATSGQNFAEIDSRQAVQAAVFSSTGFQGIHQWLAANGLLERDSSGGNRCGV